MRRPERGAATAELVTALPLLVVVTWALVWLISLGSSQSRLTDAARETARALARGDSTTLAVSRGQQIGPPGTTIAVTQDGAMVHVVARARVSAPLSTFSLPIADQQAETVTELEPCSGC